MELDRNLLSRINELDNESLSAAIERLAASFGIDPVLASFYLGDMDKLKENIAGLSQEDLDRITAALGEEETQRIVRCIRDEVQ